MVLSDARKLIACPDKIQKFLSNPSPVTAAKRRQSRASDRGLLAIRHTDITSEKLCDDLVEYLAPTLEKHRGCTLIDINPGVCLWSSKLHDFLKPKWHLLIEPDENYYDSFIKPLLEQPNSTYRHTFLSGRHPHALWLDWPTIFKDSPLLPPEFSKKRDQSRPRALNPGVLATCNVSRRYPTRSYDRGLNSTTGSSEHAINQLAFGALASNIFHSHGLVRTLAWAPDSIKRLTSPSVLQGRTAYNAGLDMGLYVQEAAGVQSTLSQDGDISGPWRRERFAPYDSANFERISELMRVGNISVPRGRQILTQETEHQTDEYKNMEIKSPLDPVIDDLRELEQSTDALFALLRDIKPFSVRPSHANVKKFEAAVKSMHYPHLFYACASRVPKGGSYSRMKMAVYSDIAMRTVNLEANFKRLEEQNPDDQELERIRNLIISLSKELDDTIHEVMMTISKRMFDIIDNEIATHSSAKLFARENDTYHPLQADSREFHPKGPGLTLFDLTPKSTDLSVADLADEAEGSKICQMFLKHLFTYRRTLLPVALDHMAINAAQDLIPMVPALTDARKGGRLDPTRVRVRMLTDEMIQGLVKAFVEWPFRPTLWEIGHTIDRYRPPRAHGQTADDTDGSDTIEAEPETEDDDEEQETE